MASRSHVMITGTKFTDRRVTVETKLTTKKERDLCCQELWSRNF